MENSHQNIFFLGIGGIGMSALARYFHRSGHRVSGYDRDNTVLTKKLVALGINIQYDFDESLIEDPIDIVVYTPAIKPTQREFQYFLDRKIEMKKRSEVLELLFKGKQVIAIAGTHGKTTTSALLAHILHSCDFGATAFVGGIMSNYDSNFIYGSSPWVIVEADEYDRSFWRLYPHIAVIQAMDADHLDIYGTEKEMIDAYQVFTLQMKTGGHLFIAEEAALKVSDSWRKNLVDQEIEITQFGSSSDSDLVITMASSEYGSSFDIAGIKETFELSLGGAHNVQNAVAAIGVALKLGLSSTKIAESLRGFRGIERRFEYVLRTQHTIIIDDYAHHPKEIDAAIAAARNHHPGKRITVVFQPHLYSRTRDFMEDFSISLAEADELILVELYPAREEPIEGVDSIKLLELIDSEEKNYVPKEELISFLKLKRRQLILLLGAGDVYKLMGKLKEAYTI